MHTHMHSNPTSEEREEGANHRSNGSRASIHSNPRNANTHVHVYAYVCACTFVYHPQWGKIMGHKSPQEELAFISTPGVPTHVSVCARACTPACESHMGGGEKGVKMDIPNIGGAIHSDPRNANAHMYVCTCIHVYHHHGGDDKSP